MLQAKLLENDDSKGVLLVVSDSSGKFSEHIQKLYNHTAQLIDRICNECTKEECICRPKGQSRSQPSSSQS